MLTADPAVFLVLAGWIYVLVAGMLLYLGASRFDDLVATAPPDTTPGQLRVALLVIALLWPMAFVVALLTRDG